MKRTVISFAMLLTTLSLVACGGAAVEYEPQQIEDASSNSTVQEKDEMVRVEACRLTSEDEEKVLITNTLGEEYVLSSAEYLKVKKGTINVGDAVSIQYSQRTQN